MKRGRLQAAALRRGADDVFKRVIVFGGMLKVQPVLPEFHYLELSTFVAGNICASIVFVALSRYQILLHFSKVYALVHIL